MKQLVADLHIHTVLSPCAAPEMTPRAVVHEAIRKGLGAIAICDHNATGNAQAAQQVAGHRLWVIAGIELTTTEEVHVLGLFAEPQAADAVSAQVRPTLPELSDRPRWMGEQVRLDASDNVLSKETKMLAAASGWDLCEAVDVIHSHQGLAIAAHVDRPSFGVFSQLGLFPHQVDFDAIEVSAAGVEQGKAQQYASLGLTMLSSSDAHSLQEVGAARTRLHVDGPSFGELRMALRGEAGRRCALA